MGELIRFGVSLEDALLKKFDELNDKKGYTNRSEAIRDLIRAELVREEWESGKEVVGAVSIIYDHHKRELLNKIVDMQHDYQPLILSTMHIHLDHDNCLETIIVKGESSAVKKFYEKMRAVKGVKHADIAFTTLGKAL